MQASFDEWPQLLDRLRGKLKRRCRTQPRRVLVTPILERLSERREELQEELGQRNEQMKLDLFVVALVLFDVRAIENAEEKLGTCKVKRTIRG